MLLANASASEASEWWNAAEPFELVWTELTALYFFGFCGLGNREQHAQNNSVLKWVTESAPMKTLGQQDKREEAWDDGIGRRGEGAKKLGRTVSGWRGVKNDGGRGRERRLVVGP